MARVSLVVLLLCALAPAAILGAKIKSEELRGKDFREKVLDSDNIWAVLFYAPWCGHCKALFPDWKKFAEAVGPSIKVGQVDCDQNKDLAGKYQVQGFPTIKFFGADKQTPIAYQGQRTAEALAQQSVRMLGDQIQERLGVKQRSSSSRNSGGKDHAIMLNAADFQAKVIDSEDDWLVEFMAPWCGHCQRLKPEWEDAAKQLAGQFKLGVVDATQETSLAQTYGVQGYPTIKLFSGGAAGKKRPTDYPGGRDAASIVNFVQGLIVDKPIPEITSQSAFDAACPADFVGICVVAFLPNILDDQSKGRGSRLDKLAAARKTAGGTFRFAWVAGGENYELEEKLGLGFGYPAMVAVSPGKKRFAVMKGVFDTANIDSFLSGVVRGKESTSEVRPWPMKFVKYPAWDGKDAAPPTEDPDL